jgi:hypothetical protein
MRIKREGQKAHQDKAIAGQQPVDQASGKMKEHVNRVDEISDLNGDDIFLDAISRGIHSV